MDRIIDIEDTDVDSSATNLDPADFTTRKAVRSVVLDDENKIALLYVGKYNHYKLPGGGIDPDEDVEEALARELMEEIGCEAETFAELGLVTEHRSDERKTQLSYCFLSKIVGDKGSPDFTEKELNEGFEIIWIGSLSKAIDAVESNTPASKEGEFIQVRDSAVLRAAQSYLNQ